MYVCMYRETYVQLCVGRLWSVGSADSASFPKVGLRKIRVVLAKGSKVLRALRGEKETQMEVEKPVYAPSLAAKGKLVRGIAGQLGRHRTHV